jgi:hypothetical protein
LSVGLAGGVFWRTPQITELGSGSRLTWGAKYGEVGVTSKSQNNPVSTNGVNSAMTQSVRTLREIKKDLKSGAKQQGR